MLLVLALTDDLDYRKKYIEYTIEQLINTLYFIKKTVYLEVFISFIYSS